MTEKTVVIVVGNEKGGAGKSTVSMHLATLLLQSGATVGALDLDSRQGTLSRYVENRALYNRGKGLSLPMPELIRPGAASDAEAEKKQTLDALYALGLKCRVIVVDTPGAVSEASKAAHSFADILVTPLNDSFLDLDVLARVEPENLRIERPSHYAEMVWEGRKLRAMRGERASFDWIVMRNRLSSLDARNKREIGKLLQALSKRIGFRLTEGFSERVIYRELFLKGLTLLDLPSGDAPMSLSHVAARQELRNLADALFQNPLFADFPRAAVGGARTQN